MNGQVTQARRAIAFKIKENPSFITVLRQAMVDDGFGNQVPDPFGTPEEKHFKVRITHERAQPEMAQNSSAGLSTNLQRFIIAGYKDLIQQGDVFGHEATGKVYRIGPVDPLEKFGAIIGYQAPLVEAVGSNGEPVTYDGEIVTHDGSVVYA